MLIIGWLICGFVSAGANNAYFQANEHCFKETRPREDLGGAIALGHPRGASGARLIMTAVHQLHRTGGRYALCTMCIGVGQGIALIVERV